jgi:hypothetical protein
MGDVDCRPVTTTDETDDAMMKARDAAEAKAWHTDEIARAVSVAQINMLFMHKIVFAVPNKNAHFQAIQGPKSLVHHRVCRLICYAVTLKIPDCCPGRYKRNYDIGMDSTATELCRSKNCNPYAGNVEQAKPQSFGLGADARSTYSLECESMLKHSQMARDASSQSPKTSPVKGDTMSIFSKSSIGQFSTNYSQSYHEPGKESYLASNHVSYHPKPNASLTDPNRNFGLDGGVDSLYKSSFVGGGKEEWFSQLPAFRPVHAAAGTSGPFCGSSTARDSYLNSGNNAELHKKNSIDAKVNKNRGKVAQTNPRPYVSDACRVAIRPITFTSMFTVSLQVRRSGVKYLPANFCAPFPKNNFEPDFQLNLVDIDIFASDCEYPQRLARFTVAATLICFSLLIRNAEHAIKDQTVGSCHAVTNSLLSINFNWASPDITLSACWFRK